MSNHIFTLRKREISLPVLVAASLCSLARIDRNSILSGLCPVGFRPGNVRYIAG